MNAKEFLIANSKELSDAVDNGYDIRLNELELLDWMETYAQYKSENLPIPDMSSLRTIKCTFCNGEGTLLSSTAHCGDDTCTWCNGSGQLSILDVSNSVCKYYISGTDTSMNCINCGKPKMMHDC